ncbi:unnamed protein product [Oikopleura dioica]|uniref:Uncharacterized protein n=1 Tax=Oikopleura dioica TaxID=34765 RepID=E4XBA9_OIKDI|nr:unnamed protein product [Oikopleura dioica]
MLFWHKNAQLKTIRKGVENLFYPCHFSVNKDAPLSFMHHLKKIAKQTNLVIILNLQKTGTSKEVYRNIWQKCDKEIYAENKYDPWISLYEGKTAANHEISLHLKLREKDEDII